MTGEQIFFLIVGAVTLIAGLMVVTVRNLVHAALDSRFAGQQHDPDRDRRPGPRHPVGVGLQHLATMRAGLLPSPSRGRGPRLHRVRQPAVDLRAGRGRARNLAGGLASPGRRNFNVYLFRL